MKYLLLIVSSCMILGCGFAGFQPPRQHFVWNLYGEEKYFAPSDPNGIHEYFEKRDRDMRSCGIDPVIGESASAKANLCLESKGWYLKSGPVCNDPIVYDDPLCVKWRAKHKR